jgi:hypothetical protein
MHGHKEIMGPRLDCVGVVHVWYLDFDMKLIGVNTVALVDNDVGCVKVLRLARSLSKLNCGLNEVIGIG